MAKRSEDHGKEQPADKPVRYTALMLPADRLRFKLFCLRTGQNMEEVGAKWIVDRLAIEERKLDKR
jgi:hypothetical protein